MLTEQQGRELAQKIGAKAFLECSALTQKNLKEVFIEAVRYALDKKQAEQKQLGKRRHNKCLLL